MLSIDGLVPIPLREKVYKRPSDIWNTSVVFGSETYTSVVAPSGTGKTTLIQSLYGIRKDYEGKIFWNGTVWSSFDAARIAEIRAREISVIFQDMRLFPECTAWENLELKRSLTDSVPASRVSEWMDRLGIADKRDALAGKMSYGEQQRLSIIRALLQPFSFLLMDEPFSHLDNNNTAIAAELILSVVQEQKAALLLADLDENTFFPYHKTMRL
jgi:putative ABC transport system ATP-binding protein